MTICVNVPATPRMNSVDYGLLCAMKKPQMLIMKASKIWILQSLIVHQNGNRKKHYFVKIITYHILTIYSNI